MARNIMVSNKVYSDLKQAKGNDKSFSEVIAEALQSSETDKKTIGSLIKFAGVFKDDTEYDEAFRWLRKMEKKSDEQIWKK